MAASFSSFDPLPISSALDVPTWNQQNERPPIFEYPQPLPRIFLAGEPQELEPEPFFPSSLWQRNGWHFAPGLEDGSGVNQGWYNVDKKSVDSKLWHYLTV